VTPAGGPRREPGRAVPPTTLQSSLARKFSRYGAAIAYTDLLGIVNFLQNPNPLFLQRFCNLPGLMDALKQTQRLLLGLMNQQCRS